MVHYSIIAVNVMIVLFILILVIRPSIKYENYSNVADTILTTDAKSGIADQNAQSLNTPCHIKTREDIDFEFKVEDTPLGWYKIPEQPNTCAIDLSSKDIQNDAMNCSMDNRILYDGDFDTNVVRQVYWNDSSDNKRCEVMFFDKPHKKDMDTYMKRQESYRTLTDCQKAILEVARLREEKRKLQGQLQQSLKEEKDNRDKLDELDRRISSAEAAKKQLIQDNADLREKIRKQNEDLIGVQTKIKDMEKARDDLKELIRTTRDTYEGQLLQNRIDMQNQEIANGIALHNQLKTDSGITQQLVGLKQGLIDEQNQKAASFESQKENVKIQLDTAVKTQQSLISDIAKKDSEIGQLKVQIAAIPPPSKSVILYQHCDYGGYSAILGPGRYSLKDLQAMGIKNDDISSVKVTGGATAKLYEDDNYKGRLLQTTTDLKCLVNNRFNDTLSSVIVE